MGLREWQKDAMSYFSKNPVCLIEAATGTGKTHLAVNMIRLVFSKKLDSRVLIVVPKNVILEDTWYNVLVKEFGFHRVGLYYGLMKEKSQITITNMQNIHGVGIDDFECVIYDEVHNYMSDKMLYYLRKTFNFKIGLTATLKRKDLTHWKVLEYFEFNLFKYTLEEGVRDNVLNAFHFHNIGLEMNDVDFEKYNELEKKLRLYSVMKKNGQWSNELQLSRYKILDERKKLLGSSEQKLKIIDRLKDKLLGRKLIVFNGYNKIAPMCYWDMIEYGFRPCIFNSDIKKKVRDANLKGYSSDKYDVVITTRALDEGYNLPKIDVALILSGGSSNRQMIQRAGRVLRKKKSDTDIYQVYFINTIEEVQAFKAFELVRNACSSYENVVM